ncbi:hypothetical protein FQN55_002780 [Onygenales sp. PD_40]|nr:hypothetical protein FQN55_002780 [Onygenales sp. PD_40]
MRAVRNTLDLNCMSVPRKYRNLGDFHAYYSGAKRAPILTIVIGGNHEASNYLFELYYGGWLAPNIYYMGASNVIRYGPFRIAGLSGIFNSSDYQKPHHERLPYDRGDIRSVYHVRDYDVAKLLQIRSQIHVGVSHDWPRRVEWFGDYRSLFHQRPHFLESAKIDSLGSPPAEQLLNYLKPSYWFSGHMHVKYSATVKHEPKLGDDIFKTLSIPDAIQSQLPESMLKATLRSNSTTDRPQSERITNDTTEFLALDKPGRGREFLELLEIDLPLDNISNPTNPYLQTTSSNKFLLRHDEEWLAITRSYAGALAIRGGSYTGGPWPMSEKACAKIVEKNMRWVRENITAKDMLLIPDNFKRHAPPYDPAENVKFDEQPVEFPNSQTDQFCRMLDIPNPFSEVRDEDNGGDDGIIFE